MTHEVKLPIRSAVLEWIKARARDAGRDECMGLLAAGSGSRVVSGACILPAEASGAHAEAEPIAIARAVERLALRGQHAIGLWHSHGSHAVFHSNTDDNTTLRLLPAMAERNLEWSPPAVLTPGVTGPDSAALPFPDGRVARFVLEGELIAELAARERTAWTRITTTFDDTHAEPRAVLGQDHLYLQARGVMVALGIPRGASVQSRLHEPSGFARARLFSLVVNNRGDTYAEALIIDEVNGESSINKGECRIEILRDKGRPVRASTPEPESDEFEFEFPINRIPLDTEHGKNGAPR